MPPSSVAAPRLFIVDNYDSFTYNLAQELGELGAVVTVERNDAFTLDQLAVDDPDAIVISPGPCTPTDAGLSNDVVRTFAGRRRPRRCTGDPGTRPTAGCGRRRCAPRRWRGPRRWGGTAPER